MKVSDSIKYIGVNDHDIDLFEGQFVVKDGMSYNSYIILDEKIAVMDSVDAAFGEQWLDNIEEELQDRKPDYLIVQHMEMDHSANILRFAEKYPDAVIVASKIAFSMMQNMFETDFSNRQLIVTEGSLLDLGYHKLSFVSAPNVHWPEVVFTYDTTEKVLFSADAFGKFGAVDTGYTDSVEDWKDEARRYYVGIVGKFGANVQAVLKKASALDIATICPLHGPVLTKDLGSYINLYDIWSSYKTEEEGTLIAYTSVYGHTKKAVERLSEVLTDKGCPKVVCVDLAREDMAACVADAFRFGKIIFASTTYAGEVFPYMRTFIEELRERNLQNKKVAFVENGSWAPMAAKTMASLLEPCKNITYAESKLTIKIAMKQGDLELLDKLAEEMI